MAPDGTLYGSAGIDNAILRFDASGRAVDVWADPGMFRYPHALAVSADGALYTAESGDVWVVTGPLPDQRQVNPRTGPEGSQLQKLRLPGRG
jgi:hypothetical protein